MSALDAPLGTQDISLSLSLSHSLSVSIHIYIYIHRERDIHAYIYIHIHIHIYVCVYTYICVYMYIYIYIAVLPPAPRLKELPRPQSPPRDTSGKLEDMQCYDVEKKGSQWDFKDMVFAFLRIVSRFFDEFMV